MKLYPAEQEKPTTKMKSSTSRAQSSKRQSQKGTAKASLSRAAKEQVSEAEFAESAVTQQPVAASSLVPAPVFVRCDIVAPDGSVRSGWEMWIGDHCFGRADSKELLLASFQRLQSPPESFHWREVRNRMQMRGRPRTTQTEEERDTPWGWSQKEKEEPSLLEDEDAEGFQELSWENPA